MTINKIEEEILEITKTISYYKKKKSELEDKINELEKELEYRLEQVE